MTMGLTRMGWRAYDAVPEPDVPHDQAHQITHAIAFWPAVMR
jgi:hypothetical protein